MVLIHPITFLLNTTPKIINDSFTKSCLINQIASKLDILVFRMKSEFSTTFLGLISIKMHQFIEVSFEIRFQLVFMKTEK